VITSPFQICIGAALIEGEDGVGVELLSEKRKVRI